jgi:hypothetical protein
MRLDNPKTVATIPMVAMATTTATLLTVHAVAIVVVATVALPATLAVAVATAMRILIAAVPKAQGHKQLILSLWLDMIAILGAIVT